MDAYVDALTSLELRSIFSMLGPWRVMYHRRMRRTETTLLIAVCLLFSCKEEKSGAEKHAEELVAQKASASAAAKASAAEVDPREAQYAAKRKALKDRVEAQMKAAEKLYLGATDADRT